mgnify:CR=1 FL=1
MATKVTTGLITDNAITDAKLSATITATTQSASDNSTSVATTAYVTTAIANLADSAPSTLNTLNELAAALGDDANFSTTVTNSIATKVPLAGGTMTGNLTLSGSNTGTNPAANAHISNELKFFNSSNTDNNLDGIGFFNSNNAVDARIAGVHKSQSSRHGELAFLVHNGSALTERVRFAYDGNVGIGTTSPQDKLHVYDGDVGIENSSGRRYRLIAEADGGFTIRDQTAAAGRLAIDTSGRVGIAEGGVIYASRFSVGKPHTHTPGSAFTNSPSSFYSEVQLGGTTGNDQKLVTFAGTDTSNVSGLTLYRYRRSTGTTWTTDGFSLRQEVDNTENIYDYINFAGGKVGIGTTTPVVNLHVKEGASNSYGYLRLEGANRGGWIQMYDGSNAVSSILTDQSGNMYLQTASGYGGNDPTTRMTLEAGGNIHVEATSSGSEFKVDSTGSGGNDVGLSTKLPGYTHSLYSNFFSSGNNIYFVLGGSYVSYINSSGTYNVSDERLKKDVTDLSGSLDKIKQLRGVNFKWIDEERGTGNNIGFIAQEVEPIIPEIVEDGGLPDNEDGEAPMKTVSYEHLVPHLVEAIKELEARVKELEG